MINSQRKNLFARALKLFEEGKSQEGADIMFDLASDGHVDSIEQLTYIFLGQKEFGVVEELISNAKNQNEPKILYLKARLIEESEGIDKAIPHFEIAAKQGSPNACSTLFYIAQEQGEFKLAKSWFDKTNSNWRGYPEMLEATLSFPASFNISKISLHELKMGNWDDFIEDTPNLSIAESHFKLLDKSSFLKSLENKNQISDYQILSVAGNIETDGETLMKLLGSSRSNGNYILKQACLFNPSLPTEFASKYVLEEFLSHNEKKWKSLKESMSALDQKSLSERLDFSFGWTDGVDLESAQTLLNHLIGIYQDGWSYEYMDEVSNYLFSCYLIFTHGDSKQKSVLKSVAAQVFTFFENLHREKLLFMFAFWTLESSPSLMNRESFDHEHDSRKFSGEYGALSFVDYPSNFKPLDAITEKWVYNIESGKFALSNLLIDTSSEDFQEEFEAELSPYAVYAFKNFTVFETSAGLGDGYYPTIPFYDRFGNLQSITTFFTHMMDAKWLEERLSNQVQMFETHVPKKLGYLNCSGKLYFGDSSWLANGPDESDLIIEFEGLPIDDYLVVVFLDVSDELRPFAVSAFRDRAKRNYEVLFMAEEINHLGE